MEPDIYFMPLGGGQRVGASCYYLRLGECNLILDAGTGKEKGLVFEPDLHSLVTTPFLQSVGQIQQIYISHAHADHVGYLPELMNMASMAEIYMTELTALLSSYQLYDRPYLSIVAKKEQGPGKGGRNRKEQRLEDKRLETRYRLDQITTVSYLQKMDFGRYQVTFLPAGHIPGAMMMLFTCGKRKILYTGDYSLEGTPLTDGCMIPDGLAVDTVILCGLHARQPQYAKRADCLSKTAQEVLALAQQSKLPVMCRVPQLSKGIEFIRALNEWNVWQIPVYIDPSVMEIAARMEQLSVPVLSSRDRIMGVQMPQGHHIYVTSNGTSGRCKDYQKVNVDFCLHEDFPEMKKFLKQLNPRQAVIVHCAGEISPSGQTIEQVLMNDPECRTQFLFAEERELYQL